MKGWARGIAIAALWLEIVAALTYIVLNPDWSRSVLRHEYIWMWETTNWLTGNDFPIPDRFK